MNKYVKISLVIVVGCTASVILLDLTYGLDALSVLKKTHGYYIDSIVNGMIAFFVGRISTENPHG